MNERIVIGLSGGVDSAYCAATLKQRGYYVTGVYLEMNGTDTSQMKQAERCAELIGIDFDTVDAKDAFRTLVIGNFISEYLNARTPNPCVFCNRHVKIETLCAYARSRGIKYVSTGHYARIMKKANGRYSVFRAADPKKDQSYMLCMLTQEQLSMLITPLSDVFKDAIRDRITSLTGKNEYSESQDVCFIPDGDHAAFIEKNAAPLPGEGYFISPEGAVLGRHHGIYRYTVGQRRGLGIALGERAFVTKIDPVTNNITVSDKNSVMTNTLKVSNINVVGCCEDGEYDVCARYHAKPVRCTVKLNGSSAAVETAENVKAVTAGQSAVFYREDELCFAGVID
ncbi:MAG TPA: tRNA 2-thiouridine(34) synthase MnmA [Bacillota bacterium]|nr:tRNA 2-thiouridine(34) synthase MnmA [Bacillota bacterium]